MQLTERLRQIGLARERAALALLALGFFCIVYALLALQPTPGWRPVFAALALCYVTAFMALASGWFWGRWFASGLGWSGTMVGVASMVMVGWHPALAVYGGLHAAVVALLLGAKMAERYEEQPGWRERFRMDEFGVARVRRFVTRAAAALPSLIVWALAPREGQGEWLLATTAGLLALSGVVGVLLLRTWGVLATALAALVVPLAGGAFAPWPAPVGGLGNPLAPASLSPVTGTVVALLLLFAVLPFVGALMRGLRAPRE